MKEPGGRTGQTMKTVLLALVLIGATLALLALMPREEGDEVQLEPRARLTTITPEFLRSQKKKNYRVVSRVKVSGMKGPNWGKKVVFKK